MQHLAHRNRSCKTTQAVPEPNQLWADFLKARGRALDTLRIEDAARADEAWAAFLYAFADRAPPLVPQAQDVPRRPA
jgi:hypothetical protein